MTTTTEPAQSIDVRTIPPRERHPFIFGSFDALHPGTSLLLINDHDPRPLYYQFEDRRAGQFQWTYLQAGPDLWRVQIARTGATQVDTPAASCCSGGACGG